jgi:hypothetical protein
MNCKKCFITKEERDTHETRTHKPKNAIKLNTFSWIWRYLKLNVTDDFSYKCLDPRWVFGINKMFRCESEDCKNLYFN